jgi:hypothetical protein
LTKAYGEVCGDLESIIVNRGRSYAYLKIKGTFSNIVVGLDKWQNDIGQQPLDDGKARRDKILRVQLNNDRMRLTPTTEKMETIPA